MKLQYLGTAAAEAIPSIFCGCEDCQKSRRLGGRNIRTRAQALLDDRLMLDFGPDNIAHLMTYSIDMNDIEAVLITHIHEDHFYPEQFEYLRQGFAAVREDKVFSFYGSEDILAPLAQEVERAQHHCLKTVALQPFETMDIAGYRVTPLPADHGTPHPYIYLISDGEKTLLYAHDTGLFKPETAAYLQEKKPRLDLVSMDCTGAAHEDLGYSSHMCLGRNRQIRQWLMDWGCGHEGTHWVCNHFSHNGAHSAYVDFEPLAAREGFETSYDGMIITF